MSHLLLTGATGLLGAYLLADLLDRNISVACLVRRHPAVEPRHRIDHLLRRLEAIRGYSLPRPVILEGDVAQPHLGLDSASQNWLAANCSAVLHSAASLEFYENPRSGEPFRTNTTGTRHLIETAQHLGITQFHYVSTAYVCGRRNAVVSETDLDVGQEFGNDYETSKFAAEVDVRQSFGRSATIYRPSIIVGDSRTSYTSTYQGFYVPLQAGYAIAGRHGFRATVGEPFLRQLGLTGDERKNFVPVDWVSAVIVQILSQPQSHGRTYHLTNPEPTTTAEIDAALTEAIASSAPTLPSAAASNSATPRTSDDEQLFQDQMSTYRNYFRDDPTFNGRNVREAAPTLHCPAVNRPMMVKLAKWAIDARFGLPKPRITAPAFDAAPFLNLAHNDDTTATAPTSSTLQLGLSITGSGGGQWTVTFAGDRVTRIVPGLRADLDLVSRLNAQTFAELTAGRQSCSDAAYAGRFLFEGRAAPRSEPNETRLFALLNRLFCPESAGVLTESPS